MRVPRLAVVVCGVLALTLFGARQSRATPIVVGGTETETNASYGADGMSGYDFTPSSNQVLSALGFWDSASNGLPRAFEVGLWETATQTLLASASIDNLDPVDGSVVVAGGSWRYETLASSVALTSGATYTLAFQVGPGLTEGDSLFLNYATLIVNPNVVVPAYSRYLGTSSLAFPTTVVPGVSLMRNQVNAQLAPAVVPEPASLTLLGTGLAALVARSRRRARKGGLPVPLSKD